MKATGIVRKSDSLGRVVIPKELRRAHGITPQTPLEIFVADDDSIVLRKYGVYCALCGQRAGPDEMHKYKNATVCDDCYFDLHPLQ